MITRNFKNMLACMLQADATNCGRLRVIDVSGNTRYFNPIFTSWPYYKTQAFTATAANAGISFGTGSTAATEFDANLEATITSGITVTLTDTKRGCGQPANPYIEYYFTVTNTGSSSLTITEVGYKQQIQASNTPERNASADVIVLIDRTVLSTPLTIAAGDAGVLVYRLESVPSAPTQIGGVDIVSWEYGTDAQIGAMIDAAHAGTIDLQEDAGWRVGDVRKISISAFTGGNNVSHAAQDIDIVITSFDDYEECGCVLQFDFRECLATGQRMNATNTTTGGYGATEMYTDTLPALAQALPSWLASRLITFSVVATKGNNSSELETVTGNKLALRSEMEIFGVKTNAKAIEGTQNPYYAKGNRVKNSGYSGSAVAWWERTPVSSTTFNSTSNGGTVYSYSANVVSGVAPFGCI